jgi:hypothetical protein
MTFMAAPKTSTQSDAFDTVSVVPSFSMAWATVPTTMTAFVKLISGVPNAHETLECVGSSLR